MANRLAALSPSSVVPSSGSPTASAVRFALVADNAMSKRTMSKLTPRAGNNASVGSMSRIVSRSGIMPHDSSAGPVVHHKPCLLYPQSPLKTIWEIFILFPVLYTVTVMPVVLFFMKDEDKDDTFVVLDIVVTVFFVLDMIVQFNSAFMDPNGTVVDSRCRIATSYLRGWFLIDLVSSLPFDIMFSQVDGSPRLFRLGRVPRSFRLFRLLRISKFLKLDIISRITLQIKSTFVLSQSVGRMVKIILITVFSVHLLGGLWHFIAFERDAPDDFIDFDRERAPTWLDAALLRDAPLATRYWASTYWAFATMTTTGYGDLHAVNSGEYAMSLAVMLFGVIGSGIIVADILNIVRSLDRRSGIQKARQAGVQQLIMTTRPPANLRRSLMTWSEQLDKEVTGISDIMPKLPVHLRRKVVLHVQQANLLKFEILKELPKEAAADLLWVTHRMVVKKNAVRWLQGSQTEEAVLVLEGTMQMSVDDEILCEVAAGDIVGVMECMYSTSRVATLEAVTKVTLLTIEKKDLMKLVREHSAIDTALRELALARMRYFGVQLDDGDDGNESVGSWGRRRTHPSLKAAGMAVVAAHRWSTRGSGEMAAIQEAIRSASASTVEDGGSSPGPEPLPGRRGSNRSPPPMIAVPTSSDDVVEEVTTLVPPSPASRAVLEGTGAEAGAGVNLPPRSPVIASLAGTPTLSSISTTPVPVAAGDRFRRVSAAASAARKNRASVVSVVEDALAAARTAPQDAIVWERRLEVLEACVQQLLANSASGAGGTGGAGPLPPVTSPPQSSRRSSLEPGGEAAAEDSTPRRA